MLDSRHSSNGTFLGFDYGLSQIGVAVGQRLSQSARPLAVLKAKDGIPQWGQVEKLLVEWQPKAVIVGLPLNMDDSESDMSTRARKFAKRLHGRYGVVVELHDERLSSFEARENLAAGRNSRSVEQTEDYVQSMNRQKKDAAIDSIAAQLILESWLVSTQ